MCLILGLNAYHPDAAACLLGDGQLLAAVAEERLGARAKHAAGFPALAIRSVLKMAGVTMRDVNYVAIGNDGNANIAAKVRHVLGSPAGSIKGVATHLQRRRAIRGTRQMIAEACGASAADCRFKTCRVEHHLAHIAGSYYASDFDQAAGFSFDASGDFTSAMFAACRGNQIEIMDRVHLPHSLGYFYTALCQLAGFDAFGEEYKVMGLSAYGEPRYLELMRELLAPDTRGGYRLNRKYFRPLGKNLEECIGSDGQIKLPPLYSSALVRMLGDPRKRGDEITQRERDIAASCQAHFENIVINSVRALHRRLPGIAHLVTAGGCALNGVCNARILRDTPFAHDYIQSAASDDGTAVGAALYVWNVLLRRPRAGAISHAYWGPEYSEAEMESALRKAGLSFRRLDRHSLLERSASELHAGQVIGWYQGRSEWGPRALGNRSILAHPGWPGMKDLINRKIKRRESFRPFAPSILDEEKGNYFEQSIASPFMMHVVKIRPEKRARLAAVCHADGTGRLHTVKRSQNELYYDLIRAFAQKSGTPVVLNTSFNENEPIVDTPEQAVNCFVRTEMDALFLGPFMVRKTGDAGNQLN